MASTSSGPRDVPRNGAAPTAALLESCPTKILLPNAEARSQNSSAAYRQMGLSDRQIEILSFAIPKRNYYYMSALGQRLFDVGLGPTALSFVGNDEVLTFTLSGLSKVSALPQMKVAWVVTSGPSTQVETAMARLEIIADTYLSMNAPVQWAVSVMLEQRRNIQGQLLSRVRTNLAVLDRQLAGQRACERLYIEARRIVQEVLEVESQLKGAGEPLGTLRIACPPAFARLKLLPLVSSFMHQYPKLKTKPSPIARPTLSTPSVLVEA